MHVSVKCCLKYYTDITLRVQAFDKRLDYFYVTRKYDGPLAVQWLFINIYYEMENKTTITHFLF